MSAFSPKQISAAEAPVRLTRDVAEQLRITSGAGAKIVARLTAESGGLLTATGADESNFVITGVEVVPCEHFYGPSFRLSSSDILGLQQELHQIAATRGRRVVGYFRSCAGEFDCSPDDIALVKQYLPQCDLMIIVKPFSDGHVDMLALRLNSQGQWKPVTRFELSGTTAPPRNPGPPPLVEKPWSFAPSPVPAPQSRRPEMPMPRLLARVPTWAVAAAIGFVLLVVAIAFVRRPAKSHIAMKPENLGLHVEMEGRRLHVMWNHSIEGAKHGILRIEDGALRRELALDATEVDTGSILFQPSSNDVVLRLEVNREGSPVVAESLRVLDGIQSAAAPEVSMLPPIDNPYPAPEPVPALSRSVRQSEPWERNSRASSGTASRSRSERLETGPAATRQPTVTGEHSQVPERQQFAPPPKQAPKKKEAAAAVPASVPAVDAKPPVQDSSGLGGALTRWLSRLMPGSPKPPAPATPPPVSAPAAVPTKRQAASAPPVIVPPRPVRQVRPSANQIGSIVLNQPKDVEVQVKLDEAGHVREARLVNNGSQVSQFLANQALNAAKEWTFEPASVNGRRVASTTTIVFSFRPRGQ